MKSILFVICAFLCTALTAAQGGPDVAPFQSAADAAPLGPSPVAVDDGANTVEKSLRVTGPQRPSVYYNLGLSTGPAYPEREAPAAPANVQPQGVRGVDASRAQIAAAIAQGANPNHFGIQINARYNIAQTPNPQNPHVWIALDNLRGRIGLTIEEILNILAYAVPGKDYPVYNDIPNTRFSCENVKQAGFYADTEAQCQVIRRCDINGVLWSYLCPNMTLFNQITLVCDWFYNVNCNNAVQFYDYSNPRLYTQFVLLDTPNVIVPNPLSPYPGPGPYVRPIPGSDPVVYRPRAP